MVSAAWSELNFTDKVIFIHDVLKIDNNTKEIIKNFSNKIRCNFSFK